MESHSMRSLQKKRTTNFREDETKLLIQLWGSPQIQNKLYLTHRKEPVMRLLAANMQQRGFYRTPDEIKTRIRNLKCLYHRIKRTVQSGAGIGTVDPDWPHYKAMDAILSRQNVKKDNLYRENVFEGPRCEDIKQEIEDIDINDDMESYTTNSMQVPFTTVPPPVNPSSEFEEEQISMPPLTPAPSNEEKKPEKSFQTKALPKILPNLTLPLQNQFTNIPNSKQGSVPSLPFPLLILNGLQPQNQPNQEKRESTKSNSTNSMKLDPDVTNILRELLDVQKENLDLEKERLELEKQRLEFERFVGSQLLAMGPVISGLMQRIAFANSESDETKNGRKRSGSNFDMFKESKILRSLLNEGIKKYMMGEEDNDSENDDSRIENDGNSNSNSNK